MNLCPQLWKLKSEPLDRQGSPTKQLRWFPPSRSGLHPQSPNNPSCPWLSAQVPWTQRDRLELGICSEGPAFRLLGLPLIPLPDTVQAPREPSGNPPGSRRVWSGRVGSGLVAWRPCRVICAAESWACGSRVGKRRLSLTLPGCVTPPGCPGRPSHSLSPSLLM